MRLKFLLIIASFLFVTITISSCLDSDNSYEANADATVTRFSLDTTGLGKRYPFTIDQLNRLIYNADSLPVGADTIIDSILVDTFYVSFGAGYVTSGLNDTLFNIENYQDLRSAAKGGMEFTAHAPDLVTSRKYILKINIHQQDPDSLQWTDMTDRIAGFATGSIANRQKSVSLNGQLLVYVTAPSGSVTVYKTPTQSPSSWEEAATNLPQDIQTASVVKVDAGFDTPTEGARSQLYMSAASGNVYSSADGTEWTLVEGLSGPVKNLVTSFEGTLTAIVKDGDALYLANAQEGNTAWQPADRWTPLPYGFPTEQLYSTSFRTSNQLNQVMVVGRTQEEKIIPWAYDGQTWAAMNPGTTYDAYCQTGYVGYNPCIMHYGGQFYIFGERLESIYASQAGLAWTRTEKKFLLPQEVYLGGNYSMTTDDDNFIWLIVGGQPNEVWRGRLNRLGFKNQE